VVELFPETETPSIIEPPEEIKIAQENLISTFDADSQNIVNSIDKQVEQTQGDTNPIAKAKRRPIVGVKHWNQFMKDNW
jgi:putative transposase